MVLCQVRYGGGQSGTGEMNPSLLTNKNPREICQRPLQNQSYTAIGAVVKIVPKGMQNAVLFIAAISLFYNPLNTFSLRSIWFIILRKE